MIGEPAMTFLSNRQNRAQNTKQSIVEAYQTYNKIKQQIREAEKMKEEIKNAKPETIHFDANEVERIVWQSKDGEER